MRNPTNLRVAVCSLVGYAAIAMMISLNRAFLLLAWLVGCVSEPNEEEPKPTPDQAAKDREECRNYDFDVLDTCPLGFSHSFASGASIDGIALVEDVAESVCNDKGWFIDSSVFDDIDVIGMHVLQNSECTAGCFLPCGYTNVCMAKDPAAQTCIHACTPVDITKTECEAFLSECLGDPLACG